MRRRFSPLTLWAISVVLVWCAAALALHQPLWAQQSSQSLRAFGVVKGEHFDLAQGWKLVVSQWLHVKPPHMLFNALILGVVGRAAETRWGRAAPALIALTGGTFAQGLLVVLEPQAFISGASQAYMALCGFALAAGGLSRLGQWLAWTGILIGLALDVFVSGHGGPKIGHVAPLMFGAALGLLVRRQSSSRARAAGSR